MATRTTTKKSTGKTAPVKKSAAKKPTTRKAPVKRTATKKSLAQAKSFKLAQETQPFTSFRITEQTVYWLTFTVSVLFLGLWILQVNIQVQELYDQIDQNRISQMEVDEKFNRIQAEKRNQD